MSMYLTTTEYKRAFRWKTTIPMEDVKQSTVQQPMRTAAKNAASSHVP